MTDKKLTDKEVCPYCHQDNEGYIKMFGRFYLRNDRFNGWNLYAGKGKPLPIKFCPICGRLLKIEQTQVYSIQNDFCGVPCEFMQDKINSLQEENENLKDILYDADGVNLVNYWYQQCKIAENGCRNYGEENKSLKAEIERLKDILICFMGALSKVRNIDDIESISVIPLMTELNKGIRAEIKAEAYKEFAEKLRADWLFGGKDGKPYRETIDNLIKEMVGESK